MAKSLAGAAGNSRSGPGRRLLAFALVPVAGLMAACGGGGGSGPGEEGSGADLLVLQSTPTNGQETLTTLGDPGLGGRYTAQFTDVPKRDSLIDPNNFQNGLTPNVQILDQNFARVPGTPSLGPSPDGLDPVKRYFTFTPEGGSLSNAQYTVTISKNVVSTAGKRLYEGLKDFSTSWTVGPDIYPPVVRNTSPAALQNEVALFAPIVITFNESLEASSVVLQQTVFIEDGGTNPPTPINGTLTLDRDGFDMVFKPDPCVGLPPSTTVVVRLFGTGNTSFIRDRVNNGLQGPGDGFVDLGTPGSPVWEYQFQFNTKGVKPLPNPTAVPPAGHIRAYLSYSNNWYLTDLFGYATGFQGNAVYALTGDKAVLVDTTPVYAQYFNSNNSVVNPALAQQVLQFNKDGSPRLNALGVPYGGDWEAKLNGPVDAILDFRFDPVTFHTYLYVVEQGSNSVAIVNTGTGKIEGRFKGVGTPRGITITGALSDNRILFVSNFGQGTVTGIPLDFTPGLPICTAVKELNDDITRRVSLSVGRNPAGMAADYLGANIVAVVNQGDDELVIFDPTTLEAVGGGNPGQGLSLKYGVGAAPTDVVMSQFIPGLGRFMWTTNQGGPNSPFGSVSLWWNVGGGFIFSTNTGQILGTFEDKVNIPGKPVLEAGLLYDALIPNTGGDDIIRASLSTTGNYYFVQIVPAIAGHREVGPNPTAVTVASGAGLASVRLGVAALAGTGQVALWDTNSTITPPALLNIPGVRLVFSEMDQ